MNSNFSLELDLPIEGPELKLENARKNSEDEFGPASWRRLFQYVYSHVRDRAEAEDLTQDVFVVLLHERQAGRPVERIGAWMRTVAKHMVYRRYHKRRPDLHLPLDAVGTEKHAGHFELEDAAPSPEKQIIDQEMLRVGVRVLYELPDSHRECVLMYFRGYDFQQIASVLGISRWTARRLTLKAVRDFQARVNPS
jgi:RNA polymerase sigma factor (sigma-70 family)